MFFREVRFNILIFYLTIYTNIRIYASMNLNEMKKSAARAATLMKAMSSENRLMLLCLLNDGEKSVSTLAEKTEMRHASVSQQLALLRKDGLVKTRPDAQTVYYSLKGDEAQRITTVLYELYCTTEAGSKS
jgi:DNA-binding transcriptional ArsR family regulator